MPQYYYIVKDYFKDKL